jgi:hypothetical protein
MSGTKLWLVEIHDDDFEYDCFVSGAVWAETAAEAKRLIRESQAGGGGDGLPRGDKTRLTAKPARKTGVVHVHWHAG